MRRKADAEIYEELMKVMQTSDGPSTAIQHIGCILKHVETVNSIVMSAGSNQTAAMLVSTNRRPPVLHDAGAATECVTLDGVLARRRADQLRRAQEEAQRAEK